MRKKSPQVRYRALRAKKPPQGRYRALRAKKAPQVRCRALREKKASKHAIEPCAQKSPPPASTL